MLTTGIPALDELLDDVRIGDNLVVLADSAVPVHLVGDRFVEAVAEPGPLVVAATSDRAVASAPASAWVLDHRSPTGTVDGLIDALADADERVGEGAAYLIDSLSTVQERWGAPAALELFLATCPRLYRRGSVAMWLLDAEVHDEPFLARLKEITQVVVRLHVVDDEIEAEVLQAAGRAPTTRGRRARLREEDGQLVRAGAATPGRDRLGVVVREQRLARGLSQAELARRIGVTPSALSQVERGVRGLSAESLIRIWEVLGVPFGPQDTLQQGYHVARRSAHREVGPAPGVTGVELYDDPVVGRSLHLHLEAEAAGRRPLFAGKAVEVVFVLRGVFDVQVGGRAETLHEGDSLIAVDAVIETWSNPGPVATELLWSLLR